MGNSLLIEGKELKQVMGDLKKTLFQIAMGWARKTYKTILGQADNFIAGHRDRKLSIVHKRGTWYRTWFGPVRITRRQYHDQDGTYHYLLDFLIIVNSR